MSHEFMRSFFTPERLSLSRVHGVHLHGADDAYPVAFVREVGEAGHPVVAGGPPCRRRRRPRTRRRTRSLLTHLPEPGLEFLNCTAWRTHRPCRRRRIRTTLAMSTLVIMLSFQPAAPAAAPPQPPKRDPRNRQSHPHPAYPRSLPEWGRLPDSLREAGLSSTMSATLPARICIASTSTDKRLRNATT